MNRQHEGDKRIDPEKGAVKSRRHDFDEGKLKLFEKCAGVDGGGKGNETG